MERNNDIYVAIATIKYKSKGYPPKTLTLKKGYICIKYNNEAVRRHATKAAEEWKLQIEKINSGLELTYTVRIQTTSVTSCDIIGADGKIL